MIIAGGLGNLIDRLFRGFVVDYIEPLFIEFAIFNFADILVTCGCIALAIWMIYDVYRESKKEKGKKEGKKEPKKRERKGSAALSPP